MSRKLTTQHHVEYSKIVTIIERARINAFRAVNHELISMYWDIGKYSGSVRVNISQDTEKGRKMENRDQR